MSRGRIHGRRLKLQALDIPSMKFIDVKVCLRSTRIAADLVHGNQRIVHIKSCVLETLRHNWPRELLPPGDEIQTVLPATFHVIGRFDKQDLAKEIEGCPQWITSRCADCFLYDVA